jgi:hypothetical protein
VDSALTQALVGCVHRERLAGGVNLETPILSTSAPASLEELLVPFPAARARVPMATQFRSTWLNSSLVALRERGHFERYVSFLPETDRAAILESVAGTWLPIYVAVAHYRACDALGLSKREAWELGMEVTRRAYGTSLALAFRLAKQAGVTPWSVLEQLPRVWERVWCGGGVAVHKRGPKEALVEIIQWPPAGVPYVRHSLPAVMEAVVELFCKKAYVTEVTTPKTEAAPETVIALRVQWA